MLFIHVPDAIYSPAYFDVFVISVRKIKKKWMANIYVNMSFIESFVDEITTS